MISLQDISYRIGNKQILDRVSLEAPDGELLVILGNNGAGKSTLLKIICNDLAADSGTVLIGAKDATAYSIKELSKKRAVLRQHTAVNLPFAVREIVMMGRYPYFRAKPSANDTEVVHRTMEQAGVLHLADRNYLALSGGEQQRVQLARVLAQASESTAGYLLLDEPVNSLDVAHQHNTLRLAKAFAQQGRCVIAVLHDLNLAAMYADKVLLLKTGSVLAYGTPKEVFTGQILSEAFGFPAHVQQHPQADCVMVCFGHAASAPQPARAAMN